jgi:hypothetical protein
LRKLWNVMRAISHQRIQAGWTLTKTCEKKLEN